MFSRYTLSDFHFVTFSALHLDTFYVVQLITLLLFHLFPSLPFNFLIASPYLISSPKPVSLIDLISSQDPFYDSISQGYLPSSLDLFSSPYFISSSYLILST